MRYQRDFQERGRPYPAARGSARYVGQSEFIDRGGRPGYDQFIDRGSRPGYDREFRSRGGGGYGRDYWWLGQRAMPRGRYAGRYEEAYRDFSDRTHPRYSPVGGMQPGSRPGYVSGRSPMRERENVWFSDWTRWF